MYSGLPPLHRRVVKTTLATAWALSGAAGLSAVIASPNTIISEIGTLGTVISGVLLTIATATAVIGVVAGRYWFEWIAAWGAAVALVPYLVTVWALTLTGEPTRSTQAFLVTSLLAFYLVRVALCAAHAAKLRIAHEASALIENALTGPTTTTEGGASDDAGTDTRD